MADEVAAAEADAEGTDHARGGAGCSKLSGCAAAAVVEWLFEFIGTRGAVEGWAGGVDESAVPVGQSCSRLRFGFGCAIVACLRWVTVVWSDSRRVACWAVWSRGDVAAPARMR